ncbi:unnamed protein product [Trifolium pratense]|uniref:Uncharacterized protein n=1 Tax=Trifolium pratense TaxID=57577 RepID=A0ACB0JIS0_TRIPR|nr:unnamed protein product [Trifolium pratense]
MDWNYVKAVDLYVVFNSFVPPNGMIKSVAVYPTQFGLQRMKEEDICGPVLSDIEDEKSDENNNEKLRAYQKSMMRFIPDICEFKLEPRDVVTEVPTNYGVKDFGPRALQHTKVDFTWDDDDPLRKRTLRRKFTDEQESAAYARQQLAHKHKKSQMEFSVPEEMKMSFEDSGNGNMMHKDNKDKDEFSFLVKSVKMKSKQILDGKTRKDGKSQFKGVEKKRQH